MPRSSPQDEEAATEHMHAINRLGQKVAAVLFLEDLCNEGETTFMQVNSKGAILPPKDVDPNSTRQAKLAMEAARDNAEVPNILLGCVLCTYFKICLCKGQ